MGVGVLCFHVVNSHSEEHVGGAIFILPEPQSPEHGQVRSLESLIFGEKQANKLVRCAY